MNYTTIARDIFRNRAERRFESAEDEREAIALAQLGDQTATVDLIYAYAPALRNGVKWYTRALPSAPQTADTEDIHAQAIMGLIEAIHAFDADAHDRLAAIAQQYISEAIAGAASPVAAFTVPKRTLTRFFGILRAAEGDTARAIELAPQYEMRRETFLSVLSAVRNVDSYDALTNVAATWRPGQTDRKGGSYEYGDYGHDIIAAPLWDGTQADAEDRILVEAAFRAVDTMEADVTRLAYGFTDYEPVPDAEIGHRLGMSRQKTQRTRSSALGKMRSALGVA